MSGLQRKGAPFYPDHIVKEAVVAFLVVALLMGLAMILPVPEEGIADPTDTSYQPRPEWYFLFLFQLLKYFPGELEVVAVAVIPTVFLALLMLVPFLDRGPHKHWTRRPAFAGGGTATVGGIVLLTYLAITADQKGPGPGAFFQQWKYGVLLAIIAVNWLFTWFLISRRSPIADGVVKRILAVTVGALSILAVGTMALLTMLSPAAPTAGASASLSPAQQAFINTGCADCHRAAGIGKEEGTDLSTVGGKYTAEQIGEYITDPEAVKPDASMKPQKVSAADLGLLMEWLSSLGAGGDNTAAGGSGGAQGRGPAGEIPQSGLAAAAAAGKELFYGARCDYCHLIAGQGGVIGPDLTQEGTRRTREWLVQYLNDPAEQMSVTVKPRIELNDQEIEALAAYLLSLK